MTWREQAACKAMDPNDFHPDEGRMPAARRAAIEAAARATCATCPVTEQCLEDALTDPPAWDLGIRGCTDWAQRRQIRRERRQALARSASEKRAAS